MSGELATTIEFFVRLVLTAGVPILLVRLLCLWLDRERVAPLEPGVLAIPASLAFDWHRDYGPLWEPGSTAFWLEPEPGDIRPGVWPMPFVKERPPRYGRNVSLGHTALNTCTTGRYCVYLYTGGT